MANDENTVKKYRSSEMVNKLESPKEHSNLDLKNEDLRSRIKFIHNAWDKISKPSK